MSGSGAGSAAILHVVYDPRPKMNIVIGGHVDHRKKAPSSGGARRHPIASRREARAGQSPVRADIQAFEYAFLLDALKDEAFAGHHD